MCDDESYIYIYMCACVCVYNTNKNVSWLGVRHTYYVCHGIHVFVCIYTMHAYGSVHGCDTLYYYVTIMRMYIYKHVYEEGEGEHERRELVEGNKGFYLTLMSEGTGQAVL